MQESDGVIIPCARAMVGASREGIRLLHTLLGLMVQQKVKVGKVEEPPGLATVEFLGNPEVLQVLVVCSEFEAVPNPFQKVVLLLQGLDDCEHLFVVDLIVLFYDIEALEVEGYSVQLFALPKLLG